MTLAEELARCPKLKAKAYTVPDQARDLFRRGYTNRQIVERLKVTQKQVCEWTKVRNR